jgi:hypothetical protein
MEVISIKGTQETPEVLLDSAKGIFSISGKSLPEDVKEFYNPVLKWFQAYAASPNPETVLKIKMDYFNTASSKRLLELFEVVKTIHDAGHNVVIEWHYLEDDEDMQDAGQDYSDLIEMPFKLISYQSVPR